MKKKLGRCSIFGCDRQAVKAIFFASGTVGEYCRVHYPLRLKQEQERGKKLQEGRG